MAACVQITPRAASLEPAGGVFQRDQPADLFADLFASLDPALVESGTPFSPTLASFGSILKDYVLTDSDDTSAADQELSNGTSSRKKDDRSEPGQPAALTATGDIPLMTTLALSPMTPPIEPEAPTAPLLAVETRTVTEDAEPDRATASQLPEVILKGGLRKIGEAFEQATRESLKPAAKIPPVFRVAQPQQELPESVESVVSSAARVTPEVRNRVEPQFNPAPAPALAVTQPVETVTSLVITLQRPVGVPQGPLPQVPEAVPDVVVKDPKLTPPSVVASDSGPAIQAPAASTPLPESSAQDGQTPPSPHDPVEVATILPLDNGAAKPEVRPQPAVRPVISPAGSRRSVTSPIRPVTLPKFETEPGPKALKFVAGAKPSADHPTAPQSQVKSPQPAPQVPSRQNVSPQPEALTTAATKPQASVTERPVTKTHDAGVTNSPEPTRTPESRPIQRQPVVIETSTPDRGNAPVLKRSQPERTSEPKPTEDRPRSAPLPADKIETPPEVSPLPAASLRPAPVVAPVVTGVDLPVMPVARPVTGPRPEEPPLLPPMLAQKSEAQPVVQHGEIAFAARLSPELPTEAPEPVRTEPAAAQPKTQAPVSQSQVTKSTIEPTNPVDKPAPVPTVEHVVKTETVAPPAPAAPQGPSSPAPRSEPAPSQPSPASRMDQVIEPPKLPASSNRDITVRVPDATERGTDVRFIERGGEVRVSVRTADADLAQTLRGGLNDFVSRMDHNGVQAEVWTPGSGTSHSQNHSQQQFTEQDSSGRQHQEAQEERQGRNKPRWVEELESSIAQSHSKKSGGR